ncbi:protein ripply1 isoform X2 [Erinaceus europaeus]|uniref:Protein ripply1 isoform X2 n=1 Tax=Erinaceus europaeus TaxID=9365 RepID=A0ABM3WQT0_ERIEU|nr:protein ripply1 isoform X2 [Erinaceus europaeus]
MDSVAPTAASGLTQATAPESVLPRHPLSLPGLLTPSQRLISSGQEIAGSGRACLWRPWMSSANDTPRQEREHVDLAVGGATGAEVTKADSKFHHPVSDGELLLQNFPVQATINLYEDSDSDSNSEEEVEEEEEEEEEEKKGEADGKEPEGYVRVPGSAPHKATAYPSFPPFTYQN